MSKILSMENKKTTLNGYIALDENGITRTIHFPNTHETKAHAEENFSMVKDLSQGAPIFLLCDYRNTISQEKGARDHYSSPDVCQHVSACAIIIDNSFSKVIGNFYMGINKMNIPTKLFTSEAAAEKWLFKLMIPIEHC